MTNHCDFVALDDNAELLHCVRENAKLLQTLHSVRENATIASIASKSAVEVLDEMLISEKLEGGILELFTSTY